MKCAPPQDSDQPKSLFFTTNEENLEDVAATIVAEHLPGRSIGL